VNPGLGYLLAKGPASLWRRARRRFRGARGALTLAGLVVVIVILVGPQIAVHLAGRAAEPTVEIDARLRALGPAALLLLALVTAMRGGIHFKPAEIQFLFPAPIGRRELLVYDALSKLRVQALSGLWVSIFILRFAALWYAAVVAAVLVLAFWQLSAQAIGLMLQALEARFGKLAPRALMLAAAALLAAGVATAFGGAPPGSGIVDVLERFASLPPVAFLSSITRPLIEVYLAETFSALVFWTAVTAGLFAILLGITLAFDVAYTEGALERAQKVARALARMRSGGGAFAAGGARRGRLRVPQFPFLRGAGPIAWRQSQELIRNYRGALMLGVFMIVMIGVFVWSPAFVSDNRGQGAVPAVLPLMVVLIMLPMMTMNLAFDFRRDLDRMPLLKSLPISGLALAAGQIIPTTLLLSFWGVIGVVIIAVTLGSIAPALLLGIVFCLVPLNAVLVAMDNLLFLLMPYRIVAKDPGRIPFMGRLMIVMFLKMLLLFVLGALAAIPGMVALRVSRGSGFAAALAVAAFLLVASVPMCYAVAAAFKAFDAGRDVPD
jgi:hypothetical protein